MENAPANPLFTDLTAAKVVWLLVIAAFALAVVIRGLRRKKMPAGDDPAAAPASKDPDG